MLLCRVATAMIFLLCMQSLVTAESALTSSAVLCVTAAPGSKLNTWEEAGENADDKATLGMQQMYEKKGPRYVPERFTQRTRAKTLTL